MMTMAMVVMMDLVIIWVISINNFEQATPSIRPSTKSLRVQQRYIHQESSRWLETRCLCGPLELQKNRLE